MTIKQPNKVQPFPIEGGYRRYLPSAFDSSFDIYETLVNMREYLNQLIQSQNELIDQWVDLQRWINSTLEDYTREQIERMLKDGTFDEIINDTLFKELEQRMTNRVNQAVKDMNDKVNSIVSASPVDVVETVTELTTKYPNGRSGIVVVKADGYYYYWQNNKWNKGALYLDPVTYGLVDKNGFAYNLNRDEKWKANADIVTLKSGYYTAYIQTEGAPDPNPDPDDPTKPDPNQPPYPNPAFPIAKNFPENLKGAMCLIEVIDLGSEGRVYYRVNASWGNQSWEATKRVDGSMSEWKYILASSIGTPRQLKRLTYSDGAGMAFRFGTKDPLQWEQDKIDGDLAVAIQSLDTGYYMATISKPLEGDTRGLPKNFAGGQVCQVVVSKNISNRKTIWLHQLYTGASYVCTTGIQGSRPVWKRIDKYEDPVLLEKYMFADKMNDIENDNLKLMLITDVHSQLSAKETQTGFVNILHLDNFNDISDSINHVDYRLHLGDWMNGDYEPNKALATMNMETRRFYSKPNSYGVIGNHDYNGVWGERVTPKCHKSAYIYPNTLKKYVVDRSGIKTDKTYYSFDDNVKKLRMIFLNSFDLSFKEKSDGSGVLITNPLQQNGFGGEQVLWFEKTLRETPKDYEVLIFSHYTFDNVFNDWNFFNGDTMRKIAEAYQNKLKDTFSSSDITEMNEDYEHYKVEGNMDFTNRQSKGIIAVFNGHIHRDDTIMKQNIRYISTLCSKADTPTGMTPPRDYNDVSGDAMDYVEIDRKNRKIYAHRYGAGIDREFTY